MTDTPTPTTLRTLDRLLADGLAGDRVLVRVDFNVPLDDGRVLDATRILAALPTIHELSDAGARVVLVSHCGRPGGRPDPRWSLAPAAAELQRLVGRRVAFVPDTVGEEAKEAIAALGDGDLCLLENLRFDPGETADDPGFAAALAALADVYVGDAFGAAHRAHASVVGVAERLERKAAGRLMEREVTALSRLLAEPERPFVALLGGAKIGGKIDTLKNLLPRLDTLLLGGGMANTFLAAGGHDLAGSLIEPDRLEVAREILADARERGVEVLTPTDLVVTDDLDRPSRVETVEISGDGEVAVPDGLMAVDVGEATRAAFAAALVGARTLFWNGPLGVFEKPPFDAGTRSVAQALGNCTGFSVIGGGETVAAAHQARVAEHIGHVSTGGGAALELLAGKTLPGVAVLCEEVEEGDQR